MRNTFLLFASWFFYYKTSGLALLILLFVTLSDWLIGKQIYRNQARQQSVKAKVWLIVSIVIDLGLLCYFKYAYFLTNMLNDMFGTSLHVFDIFAWIGNGGSCTGRFAVDQIVLPVGISFYIFQVISYTADIYRGKIKPVSNPLDFGLFVSFFPQLVAGPIVRAEEFIPQLYKPFNLSRRQMGMAVFWILNGLAKKIILSDYIAVNFVDRVFETPLLFSGFENLLALFCYSLQVYADFSGYTDIAIGVALLMGFYLPQNFDSPYKARNPQEFWRRWHMSLSKWLKTYLYIPLGGNRNATFGTWFWIITISLIAIVLTDSWAIGVTIAVIGVTTTLIGIFHKDSRKKLYAHLNSFITMLLGGLWHGASWNFMIWGGLNGIGMIINKIWRDRSRHVQMLILTIVTATLLTIRHFYAYPVWNMLAVWIAVIWVIDALRYIYFLLPLKYEFKWLSNVWAVLQTFVFITFTRLFFRSGSNLDPETANEVAWDTARMMVNQIGSAWQGDILPMVLSHLNVIVLFILGMAIHWLPDRFKRWYRIEFASMPLWLTAIVAIIAVIVIAQFITNDLQAFIYFQF